MRMYRTTIAAVLVAFICATCRDAETRRFSQKGQTPSNQAAPASPTNNTERHFLDTLPRDLREVFAKPTGVMVYRVANPVATPPGEYAELRQTKKNVAEYPVLAEAAGAQQSARELGRLFLDADTYLKPGEEWMCIFEPGYVARISDTRNNVDVVICFRCGEILLKSGDARASKAQGLSKAGISQLKRIIRSVLQEEPAA